MPIVQVWLPTEMIEEVEEDDGLRFLPDMRAIFGGKIMTIIWDTIVGVMWAPLHFKDGPPMLDDVGGLVYDDDSGDLIRLPKVPMPATMSSSTRRQYNAAGEEVDGDGHDDGWGTDPTMLMAFMNHRGWGTDPTMLMAFMHHRELTADVDGR